MGIFDKPEPSKSEVTYLLDPEWFPGARSEWGKKYIPKADEVVDRMPEGYSKEEMGRFRSGIHGQMANTMGMGQRMLAGSAARTGVSQDSPAYQAAMSNMARGVGEKTGDAMQKIQMMAGQQRRADMASKLGAYKWGLESVGQSSTGATQGGMGWGLLGAALGGLGGMI